jgi:hypothetical protein
VWSKQHIRQQVQAVLHQLLVLLCGCGCGVCVWGGGAGGMGRGPFVNREETAEGEWRVDRWYKPCRSVSGAGVHQVCTLYHVSMSLLIL